MANFSGYKLVQTAEHAKWREAILAVKPEQVGVDAGKPGQVYGVLMDVGMVDEDRKSVWAISMTAFPTGEASFRPTPGGGAVGLGGDAKVAATAKKIVEDGQALFDQAVATDERQLPEPGAVYFYLLTTSGIRRATASLKQQPSADQPARRILDMFGGIRGFAERIAMQKRGKA